MLMSDEKLSIMEIQWELDKLVLEKIMYSSINTWSEEYSWMILRVETIQNDKLDRVSTLVDQLRS